MSEAVTTTETTAATTEATTEATEQTTTTKSAAETKVEAPAFDYAKWADSLTDANKKDYAKRFKGLDDILDSQINLRKELGSRIKVPSEKATPEEVAEFRKAIGASEKVEDYKAAMPEGYELGEPQQALLGQMQKAAASQGLPVAAFENFTKTYFEMEQAVQAKIEEETDKYRRDTDLALKKEFGNDYEKYIRAAKSLADKIGEPDFNHWLEEKCQHNGVWIQNGSHPAVIKFLTKVGLRAGEDGIIGQHSVDDLSSLDAQIKKLETDHPIGQRTREQDQQIQALYRKRFG